mmetsp:Transcript_37125/g.106642  ORF Transcript_37125/g.106642 Transcript_37125/m.106642 type:complete len:221 (-) Transcript_37125:1250-1912(-)
MTLSPKPSRARKACIRSAFSSSSSICMSKGTARTTFFFSRAQSCGARQTLRPKARATSLLMPSLPSACRFRAWAAYQSCVSFFASVPSNKASTETFSKSTFLAKPFNPSSLTAAQCERSMPNDDTFLGRLAARASKSSSRVPEARSFRQRLFKFGGKLVTKRARPLRPCPARRISKDFRVTSARKDLESCSRIVLPRSGRDENCQSVAAKRARNLWVVSS